MSKIKNRGLDQYGPERFGRLILLHSQKNAGLKGLTTAAINELVDGTDRRPRGQTGHVD